MIPFTPPDASTPIDAASLPSSDEVRAVFEHASLGMALSRNRVIVRCNRVFAQLFGKSVADWVGQPGLSIFRDEAAYVRFGELAGPVLATGGIYRGEYQFKGVDGALLTCVVSASTVNPDRPTEGTIWVFDDVTAERAQQQALHEALQRFESLMANAPVGIIQTVNRCIVDANQRFLDMFGYTEDQAIGMPAVKLFPSEADYAELGRLAAPLLSQALPVDAEFRMFSSRGESLWVQFVGYLVDPADASKGTFWIISDRTEARNQADSLRQALDENQAIFDSAALGMVVLKQRMVVRCNPQLEAMFGREAGGMVGTSTSLWYPSPEAFNWVAEHVYPALAGAQPATHELQLCKADGSLFWVRMTGRALAQGGAVMSGASLWLLEDITERRRNEEALRAATSLNQAVFASTGLALIATDTQGTIQLFNAAAERLLGYASAELVQRVAPAHFHLRQEVVDYAAVLSTELGRTVPPSFEVFHARVDLCGHDEREWTYVRKDGSHVPVAISVTALKGADGHTTGYLGVATDLTEQYKARKVLQRSQDELEALVRQRTVELAQSHARLEAEMAERVQVERRMRDMAHHDAITGLPNRNLLHDRMENALRQSRRTGERMAVMFLDLDRFKNINDTLGHLVGDDLLRHVAQRLSMALRASDTLARLGGDEFVVLLPRVESRDQVAMVADKLLSVLEAPMDVQEHALHISTSIGVCICPDDGDDADVLLRNADTAMYQAKGGGRNTYRFFTERMNIEADQRYRIESALRVGVRDHELRLYFQPLVDTQSGQVFGAEALVRWQSSLLGLVPPGQFIPIAEETDLIVEIDSWVLTEACAHGARWRQDTGRDLMVAVNLSARQFRRKDLVPFVQRVLAHSGLPAHLLELEITESSLMHNVAEVIQTLDQLVALGVRLAIDDFGTGYSSLAYLKRFPVHKLKVDQSFVRDIGRTDSDLAIVKTVIALAHTLQLDLLAEGVETTTQLVTLRALGCERFQGYLFAKPVPADEVPALLALDVHALVAGRE
jgi:diguanylate cyclase (GGDEF)-like protein/PAS domain S-box-containing protein